MHTQREAPISPVHPPLAARRRHRAPTSLWPFVAPTLLLNAAVVVLPAAFTVALAFCQWDGVGPIRYAGLANFKTMFADSVFWHALANNVKWMLLFLTLPIMTGLLLASQLGVIRRGRTFFQVVLFLPNIIASLIVARIWQGMIYSPTSGLLGAINPLLQSPLAQPGTALYGVAAADMWHWIGFLTVVFFSALRQADMQQVEAALVEGATGAQVFRFVLLPAIRPTLVLMLILTVIWSIAAFEYVYILTGGGPAFSSELLSTLAYRQGFQEFNVGQAAATALVIVVLGLLATVTYVGVQHRSGEL